MFFLTALLTITHVTYNKINNREEMKYICNCDKVKRAGANGTRGPMRGTAHYIKKNPKIQIIIRTQLNLKDAEY